MREALSVGIVFLVLSSQAPVLATEDRLSKVETLPSTYALVDVSIEFAEGGARGGRSLEISGKGTGQSRSSWELKADEVTTFSVAPAAVFELLQLCYREQFFDLQSSYGVPNHIRLRPDGTIDTLATVVSHSVPSRVLVRIGKFQKAVSYVKGHGHPPTVVAEVERRIEELAAAGMRTDQGGGRSSNYWLKPTAYRVTALAGQGPRHSGRGLAVR